MHLAISEKVAKYFNLDSGRFNYGNLLPDAHESSKEAKAISHFRIIREPYEEATSKTYKYLDFDRFTSKYISHMDDDLYLGYLSHLFTDEAWVQNIFIKYMRDEERKLRKDQLENYYHDFVTLNKILIEEYHLDNNISVYQNDIEEISEVKIQEITAGLTGDFDTLESDQSLRLLDRDEILTFIEETSRVVILEIENRGLRTKYD